ncbi:DUF4919 domain-containing protein [uncultured Apibacter sp.]|uniref:DUF4919 domain-containing protein n=1 Tax=uncultured Apibacter sp. TaxID=1778616 RepID=UPI0025D89958|nr:DUF4919 domain-containing protein [uncultured Apibacter sp.]
MKLIYIIINLFILKLSFSQQINYEKIKETVNDINSPYYYENIISDFLNKPLDLQQDHIKSYYLYYGKLYSSYYTKNFEFSKKYLKFMKLIASKKYNKALILGEEFLKNDPINLTIILNLIICYNEEKNENVGRLTILKNQAEFLMKAIADYGDGRNKETAFKVISTGDEYALLNYIGINIVKYTRNSEIKNNNSVLDIWSKDIKYQKDKRNEVYIEVIYNVAPKIK